jgi:hypothetical protein
MRSGNRYVLRIARLDGRPLDHDPGPMTELFDPDITSELYETCRRNFVPLACAAEREPVSELIRHMPWLDKYVLLIEHPDGSEPLYQWRSTDGWEA